MSGLTIKMQSRVDVAAAVDLQAELVKGFSSGQNIVLDCAQMETCGTAAAQLLMAAAHASRSGGQSLKFLNVSQAVQGDLETLGLTSLTEN